MTVARKKLIEVALPLPAINDEGSARKRKAPAGYPTTFHKWWAQRPVAAARAVIFAQMVDDPTANTDLFPTVKAQQKERARLFKILEDLVKWENTTNEKVLQAARDEIWQSWRRACADNADHRRAADWFDRAKLPAFHDPFAGSGALPLEAQRLGLESHGSDLNPVAVLINKAMLEIPARFAKSSPVNPKARDADALLEGSWKGAQALAGDVRYYGEWMRNEAARRIGVLYPGIGITAEMAKQRPDLRPYVDKELTVAAWLWARTVKSPNPAFANVDVPLASTFMLSTKEGRQSYVEPVIEAGSYRFTVKTGKPKDLASTKAGTKLPRANFRCLMSGTPISGDYIKAEGRAGRLGVRLMAIVAEGSRGRIYLAPTADQESAAGAAKPEWEPEGEIPTRMTGGNCTPYGLTTWGSLFTDRQLVGLTTFCDLIGEVMTLVRDHAVECRYSDDLVALRDGGSGATAYAEAVGVYLACAVDRLVDYGSAIATWRPKDSAMRSSMAKQAIPMTWDFAEGSPFGESSAGFMACVDVVSAAIRASLSMTTGASGFAHQADAATSQSFPLSLVVSTDPPYYNNIGYADLSDFFYVWLRRSLRHIFPDLFATLAVPKAEELVATPHRHGSEDEAELFFLTGMTHAMRKIADNAHPAFPVTIYYAFKQTETEVDTGASSTGWVTFLDAVIRAGFSITGTWPMRTEGDNRQIGIGANALASSVVLVCRPRDAAAPVATRREFITALKTELPKALAELQRSNLLPVDLEQAAVGPGMAVFTRYSQVLDADGIAMTVGQAYSLVVAAKDEALTEQDGDFDADTRWALAWFDQAGFAEGDFGSAESLSKSKNTSVKGLASSGIVRSGRGKVQLLKPSDLPDNWDPTTDKRVSAWESVHQLIRVLESSGESAAAELVAKLGSRAEVARELCYRLYTLCERKKRAAEALSYNALVQSFPELERLARDPDRRPPAQPDLLAEDEE